MAGLDEMWARFSLFEEEERGAEVSQQRALIVHRLASKFLTKRVLNVNVVARTLTDWRAQDSRRWGQHSAI